MKTIKRIAGSIIIVFMVASCNDVMLPPPGTIHVTGISIDGSQIVLAPGETHQLDYTISPGNADNQHVLWSSSNYQVARVNSAGIVTAVNTGQAVIMVITEDGEKTSACEVNVTGLPGTIRVTEISIDGSQIILAPGGTQQLDYTISPGDADNQNVLWSSSNYQVATVNSDGIVTAVNTGQAVIMVITIDGGKTSACEVNVTGLPGITHVTGISIDYSQIALAPGGTQQLGYAISPGNADNQNVLWSSSNYQAATVNSAGIVTAVNTGQAIITVITVDGGKTAACEVNVTGLAGITQFNAVPGDSRINLTWVNPTTPAFESVIIDSSPAAPGLPIAIPAYALPNNSHTIQGLTNGLTYTISIRAHYSDGSGSGAMVKNVTPAQPIQTPFFLDSIVGIPDLVADPFNNHITGGGAPGYITSPLPPGLESVHLRWTSGGPGWVDYGDNPVPFVAGVRYAVIAKITAAREYSFMGFNASSFIHPVPGADPDRTVQDIIERVTISPDYLTAELYISFHILPTVKISGKVYAADGVSPVQGAELRGLRTGDAGYPDPVMSGADGSYTINNVKGGEYTIHAFYLGMSETLGPVTVTTADLPDQNVTLSGQLKVTELDLTGILTDPVPDALPVYSVNLTPQTQYTAGNVVWTTEYGWGTWGLTDYFRAGRRCTAVFSLTAAAGYTFSGIRANTFTYTGATVTHSAGGTGPLEITVTYPAVPVWVEVDVNSMSGSDSLLTNLQWIKDNGEPGRNYTITVTGNESIGPQRLWLTQSFKLVNTRITLKGVAGGPYVIALTGRGSLFDIKGFDASQKISLVLDQDITLEGLPSNNAPLVSIAQYAELLMNNGSTIINNLTSGSGGDGSVSGGGVYVSGNSVFTMSGGTISANQASVNGGGVYIGAGSAFTMTEGTINGNQAGDGGGVYTDTGGAFTMTGGTINGNQAGGGGGGVAATVFTMTGGTISGNQAGGGGGGVAANTFTMSDGIISGNQSIKSGGGVLALDAFTMTRGKISGNKVTGFNENGGGVYITGSLSFTKSGNSFIYGDDNNAHDNSNGLDENTAENGAGHAVYCSDDRERNSNALAGQNINTSQLGPSGGWE
jgi:uncharacterized protein YjdB